MFQEVKKAILADLLKVGKAGKLKGFEQVGVSAVIDTHEISMEIYCLLNSIDMFCVLMTPGCLSWVLYILAYKTTPQIYPKNCL